MAALTIHDLHEECKSLVVGPLIFNEIQTAFDIVFQRISGRLIRDGFDEDEAASSAMAFLVTEPKTRAMSPIRKLIILDYLEMKDMGVEMTLGIFRKALRTTIYRHLLTLHPRGYVENLVDRAVEELARAPYIRVEWAKTFRFFILESYSPGLEDSDLPDRGCISQAVAAAAFVEKLPQRQMNDANSDPYAEVRLSKVYGGAEFSSVLNFLMSYANGLSKTQIFEFFQELLTFYRQTTLPNDVKSSANPKNPAQANDHDHPHSDLDALRAISAANETWARLSPSQRLIFRMKAEGVADLVISKSPLLATHNGGQAISRVTVLNMRTEMQQQIKDGLGDLDETDQEIAWNRILGKAYADEN